MGGGSGGGFGGTKGSGKWNPSEKDKRLYGKPGEVKREGYKETTIGKDGRATKETHHTDHGQPKQHTNPHEHKIDWGKNDKPIFGKGK